MAAVDYFSIEVAIETILKADATLGSNVTVMVEEQIQLDPQGGPKVYIYADSRRAPPDIQRLRAGTSTDIELLISVWCFAFNMDPRQAAKDRDTLVGNVELSLMADRTLNGTVQASWLEGGEFQNLNHNNYQWRGAEIRLTCMVQATR